MGQAPPVNLPPSCQSLPAAVRDELERLHQRLQSIGWLAGPCSKRTCVALIRDYFSRLDKIPAVWKGYFTSEPELRGMFGHERDSSYEDFGKFGIKWIDSWEEAVGWRSHCYLRGNISALSRAIDYLSETAQSTGRDAARHDCWNLFGEAAKQSAPDDVRDGAWFTAGACAAWYTISDVCQIANPFEPMLQIWEEGFWPVGHVHSYQNEFLIFTPPAAAVPVFISYKWQDDVRNAWVENFYRDLRRHGVDAKLDRYDVPPGGSFTHYMTSKLSDCKRVLFVITPASRQAADLGHGGVGFEAQLANSIRLSGERGAFIIPILREGNVSPGFLRDYRWMDFREDGEYEGKLAELIAWISNRVSPPKLGRSAETQS